MLILTIWKGLEAFERVKFKPFESKFEWFERDSKHSNANSNDFKKIWSIRMQILIIWTKFKAFDCKFEFIEWD